MNTEKCGEWSNFGLFFLKIMVFLSHTHKKTNKVTLETCMACIEYEIGILKQPKLHNAFGIKIVIVHLIWVSIFGTIVESLESGEEGQRAINHRHTSSVVPPLDNNKNGSLC
jgi:hypothetical protein